MRQTEQAAVPAPTDVYETEEAVFVMMDLPGHDPSTMELHLERGVLCVRSSAGQQARAEGRTYLVAERHHDVVQRSFAMPPSVDPERIEASFDSGVLTITLHKREEAKPRRIEVKVAS